MMPTYLAAMVMHAPVKQAHMQGWPHVSSLAANIIYRYDIVPPLYSVLLLFSLHPRKLVLNMLLIYSVCSLTPSLNCCFDFSCYLG